jgi:uracil-DNA glycosylase family 4
LKSKKEILRLLNDQKEIFGDDLFITKNELQKEETLPIVKEKEFEYKVEKSAIENPKEEPGLFAEKKEDWEKAATLERLNKLICKCTKCVLHKGRNKFVFGSGNPDANVLVIGEGPGAEEDKQGLPFVGRAGMLLTDMLKAIKFERDEVYIGNIVKCRPPENRTPFPDEMDTCLPYLKKQIELIKPKVILCLGLTAAKGLLKRKESLTNLRGKVFEFDSAKVMITYHPAALLRNPHWKRPAWEDLKLFRRLYEQSI